MQLKIKNNYIEIKTDQPTKEMKHARMTLKNGIWRVKDNAIRRSILNIPLEESKNRGKDIKLSFPFLREFQKEDIKTMVKKEILLNANIMGLGKTLETIITLKVLNSNLNLIICPKSVRGTWKKELIKWLDVPETEINIIEGAYRKRLSLVMNLKKYNIINYELLRNHTSEFMKIFRSTKWDAIVCDEAHRIKNRKAKQTIGIKLLTTKYKFALTGTPIQNKPDDLWSILNWLNPFYSGESYWQFVNKFCEIEETYFGNQIIGLTRDKDSQQILQNILNEIMIRTVNDDSLPDQIDIPIEIEMTKKQQKLYKDITKEIIIELENNDEMFINSGLTRIIRLQQCTTNPELLGLKENPKFEFIKDLIEDNPDQKFVVFSKFKDTVYNLNNYLKTKNILFTGDTKDRDKAINDFINKKDIRLFIATLGAAGEGVDGLQHVSSTIIFLDREWSPAKNLQAIGRLARSGQEKKVNIYNLNAIGSIDKHVEQMVNKKVKDIIQVLKSTGI